MPFSKSHFFIELPIELPIALPIVLPIVPVRVCAPEKVEASGFVLPRKSAGWVNRQ